MQALYAYELGGGNADHQVRTLLGAYFDDAGSRDFAHELFQRTLDTRDDADALIEEHLENWALNRVALVDRVILRMAQCELLVFDDIPPKVSINEAIDVAKKFSTNKSGRFINGILDAALTQLRGEGRLRKSGRGLVGMASQTNAASQT